MRMELEQKVLDQIKARFAAVKTEEASLSVRRIFLSVPEELFIDVLSFCAGELGFSQLCTITGLDAGDSFEFIYHIADAQGILLNLKLRMEQKENAVIPSVLPIYEGATFYERELNGLLGVKIAGLPEGRQYPLPDNWPAGEYPMRKGWIPPAKRVDEAKN